MNKNKIMIVEDEVLIALEISEDLKSLGYDASLVVHNSENAIKQAESEKPNLILMDIKIKGKMDGIQTARIIKSKIEIPIIYLTAYATEDLIARAKMTEPFGYLVKPVDRKELHTTIQMAMYKSRMEKERNELLEKLQKAREDVKLLESIIPICSFCKKIRDDEGYWEQIEKFMNEKYSAKLSHGVCPECVKKHYSDFEGE